MLGTMLVTTAVCAAPAFRTETTLLRRAPGRMRLTFEPFFMTMMYPAERGFRAADAVGRSADGPEVGGVESEQAAKKAPASNSVDS